MTKDEFVGMSKEVLRMESFSFGRAAMELGVFPFGAPRRRRWRS